MTQCALGTVGGGYGDDYGGGGLQLLELLNSCRCRMEFVAHYCVAKTASGVLTIAEMVALLSLGERVVLGTTNAANSTRCVKCRGTGKHSGCSCRIDLHHELQIIRATFSAVFLSFTNSLVDTQGSTRGTGQDGNQGDRCGTPCPGGTVASVRASAAYITCKSCGNTFGTAALLTQHMVAEHTTTAPSRPSASSGDSPYKDNLGDYMEIDGASLVLQSTGDYMDVAQTDVALARGAAELASGGFSTSTNTDATPRPGMMDGLTMQPLPPIAVNSLSLAGNARVPSPKSRPRSTSTSSTRSTSSGDSHGSGRVADEDGEPVQMAKVVELLAGSFLPLANALAEALLVWIGVPQIPTLPGLHGFRGPRRGDAPSPHHGAFALIWPVVQACDAALAEVLLRRVSRCMLYGIPKLNVQADDMVTEEVRLAHAYQRPAVVARAVERGEYMDVLCDDEIMVIFSYLDDDAYVTTLSVCTRWKKIAERSDMRKFFAVFWATQPLPPGSLPPVPPRPSSMAGCWLPGYSWSAREASNTEPQQNGLCQTHLCLLL